MMKRYQTAFATLLLLLSMQGAQAAVFPSEGGIFDIGPDPLGVPGSYTKDGFLPDSTLSPNAAWFRFTLAGAAIVELDTLGSFTDLGTFTVLSLYDDDATGTLLGQNFECTPGDDYSCLSFTLSAGTYLAGVTDWFLTDTAAPFIDGWMFGETVDPDDSPVRLNLTVSAIPVPAAVWLFGTALVGLIGLGKRRKAA